jgi:GT2 family glycosyltransferase
MNISVIIPTKNRQQCLINLLKDIDKQSVVVKEVIVSDQSDIFIEADNIYKFRLNHFNHKGEGPCISRNDAFKKSSGEMLIFLDDDIHIEEDFIYELIKPIQSGKTNVVCGAICNEVGEYKEKSIYNTLFNNPVHWLISFTKNPSHPGEQFCYSAPAGCLAIKSTIFREIGMYDINFDPNGAGEDREMAIRLMKNGHAIYYNGKAKLFHLSEKKGGRRSKGGYNTSDSFNKNLAYILLKHFDRKEFNTFIYVQIKRRLKSIIKLDKPIYNFNQLVTFIKGINQLKNKVK